MTTLFSPVREFFRKGDLILLSLIILTSVYGLGLIYSATRWTEDNRNVMVQAVAILIGIVVYMIFTMLDFDFFTRKCWRQIFLFNILFILTVLTPLGYSSGGNLNWLQIAEGLPLIQPNEIVKIPFILLSARIIVAIQEREMDISSIYAVSLQAGHALFMIALIALVCGDFGTCMVYMAIFVFMAWTGGVKLRWFVIAGVLAVAGAVFLWIYILPHTDFWTDNRILRFRVLFDRTLDPQGTGYQQLRSIMAIGSGQLWGKGYLQGSLTQSPYSSALPERHNDFIFAVCGEELGMVGCLVLVLLLSLIILRCVWVSRHASDPFSAYVVMGIAAMLLSQIFFNIGMCLYILPVMGLTLPFCSYGGSSIVTLFAAMGVVSSVHRRTLPSWLKDRSRV